MDQTLLKLSLERILSKLELIESNYDLLETRLSSLELRSEINSPMVPCTIDDELLDTKEVLKILGISYNTLQSIVDKGLLSQIRINQRRIRYSKRKLFEYIHKQANLAQ